MARFWSLRGVVLAFAFWGLAAMGCSKSPGGGGGGGGGLKTDHGVDAAAKVVRIGALNDESGPAAAIGKPYAVGKRILAARVNAGGSGLLPEGWRIELVERDHGYNPQRAMQALGEIKADVLYLATSFGTPNTLPLRSVLKREKILAFPASLSSKMAEHRNTPPLGPSYTLEARRAMDWVVETAGGAAAVKAGIVYQQDDYGEDGLAGWKAGAAQHGVTIVSEQAIAPGQRDFTATVMALEQAGATHVLLTTLPSATGPLLGTAAQLDYGPIWIGNTPSWIDRFFDPNVIPAAVFSRFYWMNGLPFWGEDVKGMDTFLAAYEKFGKRLAPPDFYILISYIQGLGQLEALRRAIEAGDATREGFTRALVAIDDWTAGGMHQTIDFTRFPYATGLKTRVLQPDMAGRGWKVVSDYALPVGFAPPG